MSGSFDQATKRAIRAALARAAYASNTVRVADPDLRGFRWLVASPRGVFAVAEDRFKLVLHGWYFGIHRRDDAIYLFENCGSRDPAVKMGRVFRIAFEDGRLGEARVLVTGLDNNCHQLAFVGAALCVIDTAGQAILRFTAEGTPLDTKRPFPPAPVDDSSGAYLHLNAIRQCGDRIALMLHNGRAVPRKQSELAWLDSDWNVIERHTLAGHSCHDIVADEQGRLWHCASMEGEIIVSDGTRTTVNPQLMTRGLAITEDRIVVGSSTFGPRHVRDTLRGEITIFDRDLRRLADIELPATPTDIATI